MLLVKVLDLIVKGFEEFVYMVTYFVLSAIRLMWSYRWLVATVMFLGCLFFYTLYIYGIKTN